MNAQLKNPSILVPNSSRSTMAPMTPTSGVETSTLIQIINISVDILCRIQWFWYQTCYILKKVHFILQFGFWSGRDPGKWRWRILKTSIYNLWTILNKLYKILEWFDKGKLPKKIFENFWIFSHTFSMGNFTWSVIQVNLNVELCLGAFWKPLDP